VDSQRGGVVIAGEALVDLIVAPDGELAAVPGGGPFNAARAVARLGVDASFLGALSTDRFGRLLRSALVADGVRLDHVATVDAPTTLALAELDSSGGATYRFYLAGTSAPQVRPAQTAAVAADPPGALHVGSLGLVLEPMADRLAELVARVPADVVVLVDPNCRPSAIPDAGTYRARLDAVLDRADVVKVSTEDLGYLEPSLAPADAARRLWRGGGQVLLVTDGARPTLVLLASGAFEVPVPQVRVVDTVGAGDTFGGAFLATWVAAGRDTRSLADLEAVRLAVLRAGRAAALACTRAGAHPPSSEELDS
jgi:fructokinase